MTVLIIKMNLTDFLSKKTFQMANLCRFNKFVQMIVESEMETDVPLVWPYLGEVLGAVIVNRGSGGSATLRLGDFHSAFQSAGQKSHDLLAHTLLTVVSFSAEKIFFDRFEFNSSLFERNAAKIRC